MSFFNQMPCATATVVCASDPVSRLRNAPAASWGFSIPSKRNALSISFSVSPAAPALVMASAVARLTGEKAMFSADLPVASLLCSARAKALVDLAKTT